MFVIKEAPLNLYRHLDLVIILRESGYFTALRLSVHTISVFRSVLSNRSTLQNSEKLVKKTSSRNKLSVSTASVYPEGRMSCATRASLCRWYAFDSIGRLQQD